MIPRKPTPLGGVEAEYQILPYLQNDYGVQMTLPTDILPVVGDVLEVVFSFGPGDAGNPGSDWAFFSRSSFGSPDSWGVLIDSNYGYQINARFGTNTGHYVGTCARDHTRYTIRFDSAAKTVSNNGVVYSLTTQLSDAKIPLRFDNLKYNPAKRLYRFSLNSTTYLPVKNISNKTTGLLNTSTYQYYPMIPCVN